MVLITTAPTLVAPSQAATIAGLFADRISTRLKKQLFASDLELQQKHHLRTFVEHIDNVADWAEDVADRLAIYAIKRTV